MSKEAESLPTVLHLLPSADPSSLQRCLDRCTPGDSILLLAEGVLHVSEPDPLRGLPPGVALLCAREDLRARGLTEAAASGRCRLADDSAFTGLLERHLHCVTWK